MTTTLGKSKHPAGKGRCELACGLPRDAEPELCATPRYLGGRAPIDDTVELNGAAQHLERS